MISAVLLFHYCESVMIDLVFFFSSKFLVFGCCETGELEILINYNLTVL